MIKLIRLLLGNLIAFLNWLTRGVKKKRTDEQQKVVAEQAANLALYQFNLCPFCIKTRRVMHQLNLPIDLRDAKNDPKWRNELLQDGGKIKVPCLRIVEDQQVKWLYESNDINRYLKQRFNDAAINY